MIKIVAPLVVCTLLGAAGLALVNRAGSQQGAAVVTDGDTLRVGGVVTRLFGVDSPEIQQTCRDAERKTYPCGERARDYLQSLIEGHEVTCSPRDIDRYGRTVATCGAGGRDLGAEMVAAGWAVDYSKYSRGLYLAKEIEARNARRGVWVGSFSEPEEWRRERRR